jgi:TonB family protein
MNTRFITAALLVLMTAGCSSLKPPPSEKMQVTLTDEFVELVREDTSFAFQRGDNTIMTDSPILIQQIAVSAPAGRSAHRNDSVYVNAVITKKGNVKRAWILKSESPYFNKAALKAVVQWKYQPAYRDGIPIDALIQIAIPLI